MSQHPLPDDLHLETLAVRLAADRSQYGENSEALYLTSGYVQPSAEASARRFAGEEDGYTYGRSGNPTVSSFEMRLAALEGSEACLATSSGMSSVMLMLFSLLKAGDHVVYWQSALAWSPPWCRKPIWPHGKPPFVPTPKSCLPRRPLTP